MLNILWITLALFFIYFIFKGLRQYKKMSSFTAEQESAKLITLTDANFASHIKKGVILVDFWAAWCTPCRMIAPIVSELADSFDGKAKVGKLNVDENQATAGKYGIRSIPSLLIFKDGEIVEQIIGIKPIGFFEKAIKKHL